MKLQLLAMSCMVATAAAAHDNLAVKYRVSDHDTDAGKLRTTEMTLVADNEKSLYYNTMSLYVDSCMSTPEGAARLREIQLKAWRVEHPDGTVTYDGRKLGLAPDKLEYLYVAKDRKAATVDVFDMKSDELCRYTESSGDMQWSQAGDSTLTILGYECLPALTTYHGRTWRVWFTPEIPVGEGPWKLHGLPGLILAADGGDGFLIEALEVGQTPQPVPQVYSVDTYQKGDRRKILADHEHYINNFESMMAAEGIQLNADGSPANLPGFDRRKRAWETDY